MTDAANRKFGMDQFTVLYVDDEEANRIAFLAEFRRDARILTADGLDESLEILRLNSVDLILTDQRMPVCTGLDLLSAIGNDFPDVVRVMITAYADLDLVKLAINKGRVSWFLEKPWDPSEMRQIFRSVYRDGVDRDVRRLQILELAQKRY
jgi:response regulator RpfG family c-di-GMP phosphodiesterase